LFEIYSGWGSSECRVSRFPIHGGNSDRPVYFQDAIRRGCRYGVIASSDDHQTLPGTQCGSATPLGIDRLSWKLHHGLAAVRARELTRESLWEAFTSRRCYATTFARTLLDMRIGDLEMGREARVDPSDPLRKKRSVRVRILPWASRPSVVLVRNGKEISRLRCEPGQDELVFEDEDPLDETAIRDAPFHPNPFVVYYVRVEEPFDQTQWSSPIWLDL
jgi:hypothetical protein